VSPTRVSDQQLAESRHRYTHPVSKERLVSVTSVVGNWDDGDKIGAGAGAAVKLTKAGIDYRAEWNAKRDLGIRIHAHAKDWAMGKAVDVLPSDEPYMDALAAFCRAKHPQWIEAERAVVSSDGFGGRFDLVCEMDGIATLLDAKSGRPYFTELTLQLSAYRFAEGMVLYDKDGMAAALEPMPYIERCAGLYLDGSGKATMVECPVDETSFAAFKALLAVRLWSERLESSRKEQA
jgi:hypothetical protein